MNVPDIMRHTYSLLFDMHFRIYMFIIIFILLFCSIFFYYFIGQNCHLVTDVQTDRQIPG